MKFGISLYYDLESIPQQLDRRYLIPFTGYDTAPRKSPWYFVADLDVPDSANSDEISNEVLALVGSIFNPNFFKKIEVCVHHGSDQPIATLNPGDKELVLPRA